MEATTLGNCANELAEPQPLSEGAKELFRLMGDRRLDALEAILSEAQQEIWRLKQCAMNGLERCCVTSIFNGNIGSIPIRHGDKPSDLKRDLEPCQ